MLGDVGRYGCRHLNILTALVVGVSAVACRCAAKVGNGAADRASGFGGIWIRLGAHILGTQHIGRKRQIGIRPLRRSPALAAARAV